MSEIAVDAARIRWRCRRGVKELDVLLERFVEECLPKMPREQVRVFDHLLDESDLDLLDWVIGRTLPPALDYFPLIEMLRSLKEVKS